MYKLSLGQGNCCHRPSMITDHHPHVFKTSSVSIVENNNTITLKADKVETTMSPAFKFKISKTMTCYSHSFTGPRCEDLYIQIPGIGC